MPLRVEWSGSRLYKFIHSLGTVRPPRDMISALGTAPESFDLIPATLAATLPITVRRPHWRRGLIRGASARTRSRVSGMYPQTLARFLASVHCIPREYDLSEDFTIIWGDRQHALRLMIFLFITFSGIDRITATLLRELVNFCLKLMFFSGTVAIRVYTFPLLSRPLK